MKLSEELKVPHDSGDAAAVMVEGLAEKALVLENLIHLCLDDTVSSGEISDKTFELLIEHAKKGLI